MTRVKSTVATIIPCLRYTDAAVAIDWLCKAFGFEKHMVVPGVNGEIAHAQLIFGNSMIMLGSVRSDAQGLGIVQPGDIENSVTQTAYVIVDDVDKHYAVAKSSGALIIVLPEDQPYGGRLYVCRDIEGHLWSFGSYDPWE